WRWNLHSPPEPPRRSCQPLARQPLGSAPPPTIPRRLTCFSARIRHLVHRRKCKNNLLPHQQKALNFLRNQDQFLVTQCDKNLGPAIIERTEYIRLAFRDHLNDRKTYKYLNPGLAKTKAIQMRNDLQKWLKLFKKSLTTNEKRFLNHHLANNKEPFATFYVTMKVHKTPLKTRPIVSCSGSLYEALGIWVDDKLQHVARQQKSYFKSTFDLKQELLSLTLPPNALMFTADATSMYTNIPTNKALHFIGRYLQHNEAQFEAVPTEALIAALRLIMKNNVFTFGDTTFRQLTGTAMGTPPAPPWATIYYALCEHDFLDTFDEHLLLYRRFIDDVFGIWVPQDDDFHTNENEWEEFKLAMNNPLFELEWIVSPLSRRVDFMDLTISIDGSSINTTLYEKKCHLHLYIP
ncbi:MAG: hypothetical protein AAF570_26510, partial [Bacteroidota bacterium]